MTSCAQLRDWRAGGKANKDVEQERITPLNGVASRGSELIGLDIGTTSVKAARIRRRGSRVTVTGVAAERHRAGRAIRGVGG